jgi:hypothetical protein
MARAGLKKVVKTVKGKKGSVKRSYWVKSGSPAQKKGKKKGLGVIGAMKAAAGNHYLQSAALGALTGAYSQHAVHKAQARDRAEHKNPNSPYAQFGKHNVGALTGGIGRTFGAHAATQVLAGHRRADRLGTALSTWGGQLLGTALMRKAHQGRH